MTSLSSGSHCAALNPASTVVSVAGTARDRQPTDRTGSVPHTSTAGGNSGSGDSSLPVKDLKSLQFFYNLGIDYFRQCIQLPPPNVLPQSPHGRPSHMSGSPPAPRQSQPSTPTSNQARCYATRCGGGVTKLNAQSSDSPSAQSVPQDARRLPAFGPVQRRPTETGPVLSRSFSEPLDEGKHQRQWAVQRAVDDSRENVGADMVSSGLIGSQKIVDSAEELASLGERKDDSREESVTTDADLVCDCAWTTPGDGSLDSGCMSDQSSAGGDSPSVAVSPHQSLSCSATDQGSDDDYAVTKHLGEVELDHAVDKATGGAVPAPVAVAAASVPTRAATQSLPRYVRPMREIPPRFRRLLAAETQRVVRLCQRLNGSALHVAPAAPTDAARPSTNDGRGGAPSDVTRHHQGPYVDKAPAGQASYPGQSPVVYVTAQSSGLPVYPPASERVGGCNAATGVDAPLYVVPVGVPDASLHGDVLPTPAADGQPPSVPMLLPNPVFYYQSASLPPPDGGSAYSYVMPTPVIGGCPQSGTVEAGRPSAFVKNIQSGQTSVVGELADVGVFQSATDDGFPAYSGYYYNSPGPELLPFCSLQLMHA